MSLKKILKIIGLILLLLIATSLFLSYRGYSAAKKDGKETAKLKDYFPFGRTGTFTKETVDNTPGEENTNGEENEITDTTPNNKLVQVSENPIAGYEIIKKEYFVGDNEPVNIQQETVTVTPKGTFTRELKYGSTGEDVRRLQQTLNDCPELGLAETGPGSKGRETTLYVDRTVEAIKKIQLKFKDEILTPQKLTEPTGILDELTRKKLSLPFVCNKISKQVAQPLTVVKDAVRFIERATGNVFDYNLETGELERVTNTTIPRIQEAFFADNGERVLIRYLKEDNQTIETYLGKVPERKLGGDASEAELTGSFMQKNIIDLSVSPDIKKIFYQTKVGTSASGTIFTTKTETKNTVFSSPFSEWLPQWVNDDNISMTTKASGYSTGYLYNFNIKSGEFTRVLGDIFGLTTNISPNYKNILISKSTSSGNSFGMYDTTTKNNYDLGINTLAEKCTWNKNSTFIYCAVPDVIPSGVYPDDWYQGVISFSDRIVSVDPTGLIDAEELANPNDEDQDIDGINIKVTDDEQYVLFMNKKDGILWMTKTK